MNFELPNEKTEAEQKWEKASVKVEVLTDKLGEPVDEGIKKTLTALIAHNVATSQSCEGHTDHGDPYPWIDIQAPAPKGWEDNPKLQEKWKLWNSKEVKRVKNLLDEYNSDENQPQIDLRLTPRGIFGATRLQPNAEEDLKNVSSSELAEIIKKGQTQMSTFAKFLKEKL